MGRLFVHLLVWICLIAALGMALLWAKSDIRADEITIGPHGPGSVYLLRSDSGHVQLLEQRQLLQWQAVPWNVTNGPSGIPRFRQPMTPALVREEISPRLSYALLIVLALLFPLLMVLGWQRNRRRQRTRCLACGHDTTNTPGPCAHCGMLLLTR